MIQFILLMFGLIFPNGNAPSHNNYSKSTLQSSINAGEELDNSEGNGNGSGHGNGGSTTGNTGQTPPPFAKF